MSILYGGWFPLWHRKRMVVAISEILNDALKSCLPQREDVVVTTSRLPLNVRSSWRVLHSQSRPLLFSPIKPPVCLWQRFLAFMKHLLKRTHAAFAIDFKRLCKLAARLSPTQLTEKIFRTPANTWASGTSLVGPFTVFHFWNPWSVVTDRSSFSETVQISR